MVCFQLVATWDEQKNSEGMFDVWFSVRGFSRPNYIIIVSERAPASLKYTDMEL